LSSWRLFLAAVVPAAAAEQAWRALEPMRVRHPDARWVAPSNMHLTLLFLGATAQSEVPRIADILAAAAARHAPAPVQTAEGGGRPADRGGGVGWLRLEGSGVAVLTTLARELDSALPGARRGRLHAPHLTVARGLSAAALAELAAPPVRFTVVEVALFRSHTGRHGADYEALAVVTLGGGPG
jgi:RNA 2',3'-cyclic 3'-phosphodiesterase